MKNCQELLEPVAVAAAKAALTWDRRAGLTVSTKDIEEWRERREYLDLCSPTNVLAIAAAVKAEIARLTDLANFRADQVRDLTAATEKQQTRAIQAESKLALANAKIAKLADAIEGRGDTGILTVGILKHWSRDKRHSFCLHLLGPEWLRLKIATARRDAFGDALDHVRKQHSIHTCSHCCDVIRALMAKERA